MAPWHVGEWLSLVEHLVRDQGVGGSNPLSPTILSLALSIAYAALCRFQFLLRFSVHSVQLKAIRSRNHTFRPTFLRNCNVLFDLVVEVAHASPRRAPSSTCKALRDTPC